jgi:glutathione S-transferase
LAYPEPENSRQEALYRVVKHRQNIVRVNPIGDNLFDTALRAALTHLITQEDCPPPPGTAAGLRYLRDRISVPRDMSIYAAKRLRQALETTAALVGNEAGPEIPVRHRRDQDPQNFKSPTSPAEGL